MADMPPDEERDEEERKEDWGFDEDAETYEESVFPKRLDLWEGEEEDDEGIPTGEHSRFVPKKEINARLKKVKSEVLEIRPFCSSGMSQPKKPIKGKVIMSATAGIGVAWNTCKIISRSGDVVGRHSFVVRTLRRYCMLCLDHSFRVLSKHDPWAAELGWSFGKMEGEWTPSRFFRYCKVPPEGTVDFLTGDLDDLLIPTAIRLTTLTCELPTAEQVRRSARSLRSGLGGSGRLVESAMPDSVAELSVSPRVEVSKVGVMKLSALPRQVGKSLLGLRETLQIMFCYREQGMICDDENLPRTMSAIARLGIGEGWKREILRMIAHYAGDERVEKEIRKLMGGASELG
jgi:hypothetical protein